MAFEIDYPHALPLEDARARLHALGDYLSNKHGLRVSWDGDSRASIQGKYLVVSIEGSVEVNAQNVHFSGKDPGMLWRGKAKEYLTGKLKKYLDPSTPVADLPTR
jgi:hypothetical protein